MSVRPVEATLAVAAALVIAWSGAVALAAPPPAAPDAATDTTSTPTTAPSAGSATSGSVAGPSISLDTAEVTPGGRVIVTLDQFDSIWATLMVCGNEARRGSQDCNQAGSITKEFPLDGSPLRVSLAISAPLTDCPCVVRAVGEDTSEIAVAPLVVTGHPVGPIVEPVMSGPLMDVGVDATPAATGLTSMLRSQLGGPTTYEITVRVTNTANAPLRDVRLSASATRGESIAATPPFDDPGQIGVGQTWSQTVLSDVPAPSLGEVEWRVVASGAGPTVEREFVTTHRPWLLIALALLVVLNVAIVLIRWRIRRRLEAGSAARAPRRRAVRPTQFARGAAVAGTQKSSPSRH